MKHRRKASKKQPENLGRIPSAWNPRHNYVLFAGLLGVFFFWMSRLTAPTVDAVRAANEVFPQLGWLSLVSVTFLVWALLWHKRRLTELYGLKLAMDGRQDDVFNAILMGAVILFMGGWTLICVVNPMPTEQRPETVYTVQKVSFPGKGARVRFTLEPGAPMPYLSLRLKFLPFNGDVFQAQDKLYVSYIRGKLGFWHVPAVHWQPKDSDKIIRLFPNPQKLPA